VGITPKAKQHSQKKPPGNVECEQEWSQSKKKNVEETILDIMVVLVFVVLGFELGLASSTT
jgi:hypothetical protein